MFGMQSAGLVPTQWTAGQIHSVLDPVRSMASVVRIRIIVNNAVTHRPFSNTMDSTEGKMKWIPKNHHLTCDSE